MGDEDDAQPLIAQLADDREQGLDLGLGQRRGRLVHDDHARLHRQRARDLDHLLLGDREVAHQRQRVDRRPMRAVTSRVCSIRRRQLRNARPPGSRPMKTFSATVRLGRRLSSW